MNDETSMKQNIKQSYKNSFLNKTNLVFDISLLQFGKSV